MPENRPKTKNTELYGRKCIQCKKRSHDGAFYGQKYNHWYCTSCKPIEDYVPVERVIIDAEKAIAQTEWDMEYRRRLIAHVMQNSGEQFDD